MEERSETEADDGFELTAEDRVAADEAMLLDIGGAEQLADLIADQSLGERHPTAPAESSATTTEDMNPPPDDEARSSSRK